MEVDSSAVGRRMETFTGITNGSWDYTVVFSPQYPTTPHVNPVTYPAADSTTRVRVTAASNTGFTVRTERNAGVNLLSTDLLLLATSPVASVPVRVMVVES